MVTMLSLASARSCSTACSEKGQYLAQRIPAKHRIAAATATIASVLRNLELACNRSVEGREVVEPATSIVDDIKL